MPEQKPKGRYNWETGKVEPLREESSPQQAPSVSASPRGRAPQTPTRGQRIAHGIIEAGTNASMRQQAFRARGGLVQGIRYAAGLRPASSQALGMFRTEAYQRLALSPRQFPAADDTLEDEET